MRALLVALMLTGCAASPQQIARERADDARDFAQVTDGRVAGRAEQCISATAVDGPRVIGDDMLVYNQTGRRLWITRVEGCVPLRNDPIVVTEIYGGQLCRNDRFRTLIRGGAGGIPGPFCRFGTFTPWVKSPT